MIRDQNVPEVSVWCANITRGEEAEPLHTHVLHTWFHELEAHEDSECNSDQAGECRHDKIKQTNVFVIGREEPARKEAPVVLVIVAVNGCVCHACLP